jgi:hypothetical protein
MFNQAIAYARHLFQVLLPHGWLHHAAGAEANDRDHRDRGQRTSTPVRGAGTRPTPSAEIVRLMKHLRLRVTWLMDPTYARAVGATSARWHISAEPTAKRATAAHRSVPADQNAAISQPLARPRNSQPLPRVSGATAIRRLRPAPRFHLAASISPPRPSTPHYGRVGPAHCCAGPPSEPGRAAFTASGSSKP